MGGTSRSTSTTWKSVPDLIGRFAVGERGSIAAGAAIRTGFRKNVFDRVAEFVGFEPERSRSALVRDVAIAIDEVEPVGMGVVGAIDGVVDAVDDRGDVDFELFAHGVGDVGALIGRRWLREEHFFAFIDPELPTVCGVCLADVDHEEFDVVAVLFVERLQGTDLVPEGRSRVGTEDERDGAGRVGERAELDGRFSVERLKGEVGRGVTDL